MASFETTSPNGKWIPPRNRSDDTRVRLFCLPHAGAGGAMYHMWQRILPAFVEVSPILLPGRESRLSENCSLDCEALIGQVTTALEDHLDLPYAIFGHSMGALLASELAQSLVAHGLRPPSHLFVSGRNAAYLPPARKDTHTLQDAEFIAALAERYGGLPQEMMEMPEFLEFYLPILRADMTLLETYEYRMRQKLACPLSVFAGKEDTNVSNEKLLAWQEHTSGTFELRWFEGDHFYLTGPSRPLLLDLLSKRLAELVSALSQ